MITITPYFCTRPGTFLSCVLQEPREILKCSLHLYIKKQTKAFINESVNVLWYIGPIQYEFTFGLALCVGDNVGLQEQSRHISSSSTLWHSRLSPLCKVIKILIIITLKNSLYLLVHKDQLMYSTAYLSRYSRYYTKLAGINYISTTVKQTARFP